MERCVCPNCGTSRPHTPPECVCRGCEGRNARVDHRVQVKVAEIPKPYKDVADLLASDGGAAKYEAMIRDARPGPSWMIAHLEDVKQRDLTTLEGTLLACEDMIDVLLREPPIARGHYVRELAEKLEVPEREIRQTLNQVLRDRAAHYEEHPEDRPKPTPVWERHEL